MAVVAVFMEVALLMGIHLIFLRLYLGEGASLGGMSVSSLEDRGFLVAMVDSGSNRDSSLNKVAFMKRMHWFKSLMRIPCPKETGKAGFGWLSFMLLGGTCLHVFWCISCFCALERILNYLLLQRTL